MDGCTWICQPPITTPTTPKKDSGQKKPIDDLSSKYSTFSCPHLIFQWHFDSSYSDSDKKCSPLSWNRRFGTGAKRWRPESRWITWLGSAPTRQLPALQFGCLFALPGNLTLSLADFALSSHKFWSSFQALLRILSPATNLAFVSGWM